VLSFVSCFTCDCSSCHSSVPQSLRCCFPSGPAPARFTIPRLCGFRHSLNVRSILVIRAVAVVFDPSSCHVVLSVCTSRSIVVSILLLRRNDASLDLSGKLPSLLSLFTYLTLHPSRFTHPSFFAYVWSIESCNWNFCISLCFSFSSPLSFVGSKSECIYHLTVPICYICVTFLLSSPLFLTHKYLIMLLISFLLY
jgi:hypothetical protein